MAMLTRGLKWNSSFEERRAVCAECTTASSVTAKGFGHRIQNLDDWIEPEDIARVKEISEAVRNVDDVPEFEGVPIGKLCLYNIVVTLQKQSWDHLDEGFLSAYQQDLYSGMLTIIAGRRALAEMRPDAIIQSNGLYTIGNILGTVAEQMGIPTYFLINGNNRARFDHSFTFARGHFYRQIKLTHAIWDKVYSEKPCSEAQIKDVADHLLTLFLGKTQYTYSTKKESGKVTAYINWAAGRPIAVLSMSSWDELLAAQAIGFKIDAQGVNCFPNQIDWLSAVLEFFKARPDICLIIRPHPREFANSVRHDAANSEHGNRIRELLDNSSSENVRVNWASENISLYDLLDITAIVLNAWSSAGEEAGMMGIPSISAFPAFCNYPVNLDYFAASKDEYFTLIDKALNKGWSFERIRRFYRWRVLYSTGSEFDLPAATGPTPGDISLNFIERALSKRIKDYKLTKICRATRSKQQVLPEIAEMLEEKLPTLAHLPNRINQRWSLESETSMLKRELRRICEAIYPEGPEPGSLHERLAQACSNQ